MSDNKIEIKDSTKVETENITLLTRQTKTHWFSPRKTFLYFSTIITIILLCVFLINKPGESSDGGGGPSFADSVAALSMVGAGGVRAIVTFAQVPTAAQTSDLSTLPLPCNSAANLRASLATAASIPMSRLSLALTPYIVSDGTTAGFVVDIADGSDGVSVQQAYYDLLTTSTVGACLGGGSLVQVCPDGLTATVYAGCSDFSSTLGCASRTIPPVSGSLGTCNTTVPERGMCSITCDGTTTLIGAPYVCTQGVLTGEQYCGLMSSSTGG